MTREQLLEGIEQAIAESMFVSHAFVSSQPMTEPANEVLDYISPMMKSVVEVLCMNQVNNYPDPVLYTKTDRAIAQLECFVKGGVKCAYKNE